MVRLVLTYEVDNNLITFVQDFTFDSFALGRFYNFMFDKTDH